MVKSDTDLVVEGFPRCGNTFLVSWIQEASPGVQVASHLHSFAHIKVALRRRVPVVVVIREPEDAVASEMLRAAAAGGTTQAARLLWRYERFHRVLMKLADDVIISPFIATTTAPEDVVAALCKRTGLQLELNRGLTTDEVVGRVERSGVAAVGRLDEMAVSRPSPKRAPLAEQVKARLRERYPAQLAHLRGLHDSLALSPSAVQIERSAANSRK